MSEKKTTFMVRKAQETFSLPDITHFIANVCLIAIK